MEFIITLLVEILYVLAGALDIRYAIISLKERSYFKFGLFLMLAIWMVVNLVWMCSIKF